MTGPPAHPHDPMLHPEEVEGVARPARPWVKGVMYLVALGLLAACIWLAWGEVVEGWEKLRHARGAEVTTMVAALLGNIVLDALVFWALLIPFKPDTRVTVVEMTALVAATSLLNYLPMRVGMIGRAAYLKQQHGVSYSASVVMMLGVAGATVAIYALLLAATYLTGRIDGRWWAVVVCGLVLLAELSVLVVRFGRRWAPRKLLHYFDDARVAIDWFANHRIRGHLLMLSIYAVRAAGVALRAVLLWTAARVFGTPLEPHTALVLATAGMFATIATPLPNGLGLRESLYGVLAAAGVAGAALTEFADGGAVGLIERAVEAMVFVVAGSAALLYVHRKAVPDRR